jgi:uncharacterized protein
MQITRDKLNRGLNLLNGAGTNPDTLGLALQSIHGALKDHCRDLLSQNTAVPSDQRQQIRNHVEVNWKTLLDLMQCYEGMSDRDRAFILRMNYLRNIAAHGEPFTGNRAQIEQYAEFVHHYVSSSVSELRGVSYSDDSTLVHRSDKAAGISLNASQWATLLHLSWLTNFIIPLSGMILWIVIWQVKRQEIPQLDIHGKNLANWEISKIIFLLVCLPFNMILIGLPFFACLVGCAIAFPIIAGIKASNGEVWRYPLAIPFLK